MQPLILILAYFILLSMAFFKGCQNACTESKCGDHDDHRLAIHVPFQRLPRCRGFELGCGQQSNKTVVEQQHMVKFFVKHIDYKRQKIQVHKSDDCFLLKQSDTPNMKPIISPFTISVSAGTDSYLSLFHCPTPSIGTDLPGLHVPCLSTGSAYKYIYAIPSNYLPPQYCTKMYDLLVPYELLYPWSAEAYFWWSTPNCTECEEKGKKCRLKSNSIASAIECVDFSKPNTRKKIVATGATLTTSVLLILVAVIYGVYRSDKKKKQHQLKIETFLADYNAFKPSRYSYADIKRITNQFEDKLGEGAYGTVFKGKLSSELFVAVKVLNNSIHGDGEEFLNEVGTMGHIHHVNIVRMVGFCADGFRRALVYEFLPNGSLQGFISSADNKNTFLGWEKFKDIAIGIAKGMEYLHQGCDQRILHFDIKPHNVLLDQNFTPKISDFGMSKLCAKDQSIVSMTTARGTLGYIAPEVFSRNFGNVSYKSDVYSFGMLLLEIVGGRKNTGETMDNAGEVYYPQWIYNLLEEGEDLRVHMGEEGLDSRIPKELAVVGLWCIQWHPMNRPSMKSVVQMLGGTVNIIMPPNPFSSAGHIGTNAASRPPIRRLNLELEAIVEH